jgi:nucleoside-diphosphate-sugar epimerase
VRRIVLTGATGFTGSFVLDLFKARGADVTCLVRNAERETQLRARGAATLVCDLNNAQQLAEALRGFDAFVNVASMGFGSGPGVVAACEAAEVKRAIFVSTTAIFTTLNAGSKTVRTAAEDAVRASQLEYTILRPTMIYGTPGDRNMIRLLKVVDRSPIIPVFGPGTNLQQPVHVEDIALSVVSSLESDKTHRKAYNVSGGQVLSYNEVIAEAALALGRKPWIVHLPLDLSLAAVRFAKRLTSRFPLSEEQVLRLNEDKVFSHEEATRDFGYVPRTFTQGIRQEVALMRGAS